jgi:putative transposase
MTADLVLSALNMAIAQRRPRDVIHHSDRGSQYTSITFSQGCQNMGVRLSRALSEMDAFNNAMAESFFASLECELIDRRSFKTKTDARQALFTWIESWYNPRRRNSPVDLPQHLHVGRQAPPDADLRHGSSHLCI